MGLAWFKQFWNSLSICRAKRHQEDTSLCYKRSFVANLGVICYIITLTMEQVNSVLIYHLIQVNLVSNSSTSMYHQHLNIPINLRIFTFFFCKRLRCENAVSYLRKVLWRTHICGSHRATWLKSHSFMSSWYAVDTQWYSPIDTPNLKCP